MRKPSSRRAKPKPPKRKPAPIAVRVVVCAACFDTKSNGGRCPIEAALWRLTRQHWTLAELSVQTPDGDWLRLPTWVAIRAAMWAAWNARAHTSSTRTSAASVSNYVSQPYVFDLEVARHAWFIPDKKPRVMPKPPLELVSSMPETEEQWTRFRDYQEQLLADLKFAQMENERIESWRACGRDAPPYLKNWG